ncbi:hypothetical protein [Thiolapillus sp.]
MDGRACTQDSSPPFAGWLLLAVLIHLLFLTQLPLGLHTDHPPAPGASAPVIDVVLKQVVSAPEPVVEPAEEPARQTVAAPVREPASGAKPAGIAHQSTPGSSQVEEPVTAMSNKKEMPRVDADRLKQAVRDYRLPEWDDRKHFSPLLPEGLSSDVFSANTRVRNNYSIQAYDGHGGAQLMRFSQFGKKDRCFLVHRVGFEIEREDWDPGMDTVIGWGAEETSCE